MNILTNISFNLKFSREKIFIKSLSQSDSLPESERYIATVAATVKLPIDYRFKALHIQ